MIKKIYKKLNEYAYKEGYRKAVSEHKKELARIYKSHEKALDNMQYDHDTALFGKDQEIRILSNKLTDQDQKIKIAEQDRLICKRERAYLKKASKWVKEEITTLHLRLAGPLKTMLAVADEMDKETKDTKRIER